MVSVGFSGIGFPASPTAYILLDTFTVSGFTVSSFLPILNSLAKFVFPEASSNIFSGIVTVIEPPVDSLYSLPPSSPASYFLLASKNSSYVSAIPCDMLSGIVNVYFCPFVTAIGPVIFT